MSGRQFGVRWSYGLDVANFLNLLTGDPFYVSRHPEAHAAWAPRLSETAREGIRAAVELKGGSMLGPYLAYLSSAVPGFDQMDLDALLREPAERFAAWPIYSAENWALARQVSDALLPVVDELEELGFRSWWEEERLPLVREAGRSLEAYLDGLTLDLGGAVREMLGADPAGDGGPVTVYICSFARPHGMRITGKRFITDMTYPHESTLRIAIHEMFHPPYRLDEVEEEAQALIDDPLFQESFRTKNPSFGYSTETSFLEENVVEAMELHVSRRAGLIADPLAYLREHDEGSHRLSVVLLRYFGEVPKLADEPFGRYFKRLVAQMPVGRLGEVYEAEMASR